MRLSVKSAVQGRVEVFDHLDTTTFQDFRRAIVQRFQLHNDFSLVCGSQELPRDEYTAVASPQLGLVSGDRLRLVILDKPLGDSDRRAGDPSKGSAEGGLEPASEGSGAVDGQGNAVVSLVVRELSKLGFFSSRLNEDENRVLFRHPDSPLSAEVDFHHYADANSPCSHLTVSLIHPAKRHFLPSVLLEQRSDHLRSDVIQHVVFPIRTAMLGHENALLRLLGHASIAERVLRELPAVSVLRLERTCVHANRACHGDCHHRVWQSLLFRDFGSRPVTDETARETYRRLFVSRKREQELRIARELEFGRRPLMGQDPPLPPYRPFRPDPDLPEGPFYPLPPTPFLPPDNPFPAVPGLHPRPPNPLHPFNGNELMPSRPRRPGGLPRRTDDSPFNGGGFGFI